MSFSTTRADGVVISDDQSLLDLDRICAWLAASYWANDRDRVTIERSLVNSMTFGVYRDREQIGLCRVTTDLASFAWLGDVVVDEQWRGRGIGSWLVGTVVQRLTELGTPRIVLATRDAHEVYARLGFEPLRVPATFMEIDRRPNRPHPGDVRPFRSASI